MHKLFLRMTCGDDVRGLVRDPAFATVAHKFSKLRQKAKGGDSDA